MSNAVKNTENKKQKKDCYSKKEYRNIEKIGYERVEKVVNMIGGKWKLRIAYILGFNCTLRYGELKKLISPITHKMLSSQLKELEKDGIVIREEYKCIPPKVEYSLSKKGYDLVPVFEELSKWIKKYKIK